MTSNPDPTKTYDKAKVFFMRKYLHVALDAPVPMDNPVVVARLNDLERLIEQDAIDLQAEFEKHPMPDFSTMGPDAVVDEIGRTFPDQTFEKVPGSDNKVKINGVVEFDAKSLRRLPPSQRKELFEATKKPEGEEKRKALKKLGSSGKMRLRIPQNATDGRAHLDGIVDPTQKGKLDALYNAKDTTIDDAYRAWDILNKINESDPAPAKKLEKDRHRTVLKLALDLDPANLRDMVECFEFADLVLDRQIEEKALALAKQNATTSHAKSVQEAKDLPNTLKSQIEAAKKKIVALEGQIKLLDPTDAKLKGLKMQLEIQNKIKTGKEDKLKGLPEKPEDHVPPLALPDAPSADDRKVAAAAVFKELAEQPKLQSELAGKIATEFSEYVAAVASTGNKSGSCACSLVANDILPNAQAAVDVAKDLRFGSDRAAAYHTQKHFGEIPPGDQSGSSYRTTAEQRVDRYHVSARSTVSGGNCVKSSVGQNGGESHLFQGAPCTAIVWLNNNKAGLATYFRL